MRNVPPRDPLHSSLEGVDRGGGPTIVLASASPRRLALLRDAGFAAIVVPATFDDDRLPLRTVSPEEVAASRAWLKASAVALRTDLVPAEALILAADTICAVDDTVVGKPRSRDEASRMLRGLHARTHRTITAVAIADRLGRRSIWWDVAFVTMGAIDEDVLDAYVASDRWRGKSGGYNLAEAVDDGWPIACEGDPTSVMGLPMRRLRVILGAWRPPDALDPSPPS